MERAVIMLKLWQLEELSQLIYKRNSDDLESWISDNGIVYSEIYEIQGNDRAVIFMYHDTLYVAVAGSDDKQDWKENIFQLKKIKRLKYSYKGVALPGEDVLMKIRQFCNLYCVDLFTAKIRGVGHSRGSNIIESLISQIEAVRGKDNLKMYGFGGTGAGGRKFAKLAKTRNYFRFVIKGDFAKWINPFDKCCGKVIYLPKQRKGFLNRLTGLFKGKMNHREYHCIKDTEYAEWT
jgi:hypothetical protein